jgi:hypothetical protein
MVEQVKCNMAGKCRDKGCGAHSEHEKSSWCVGARYCETAGKLIKCVPVARGRGDVKH